MYVVLYGCSQEKFVLLCHMTIMFISYFERGTVILCKGKNLSWACAMTSSGSMLTGSVFGRDELNTKCQSDDLKLRDNWEDRVVDWRDIIKIDRKCCD